MNEDQLQKYNEMVRRINNMSREEIEKLIQDDKCPFEPQHLLGVPLGMFHCELCGQMVVAGVEHPRGLDPIL